MENDGQWYREIGDTYADLARTSAYGPAKSANAAEATKYYAIAERFDSINQEDKDGPAHA